MFSSYLSNRRWIKTLTRKMNARMDLDKVISWANKRRISISFENSSNLFDTDDNSIVIDSRQTIENQLCTLLHECGHFLCRENTSEFEKKYYAQAEAEYDYRKKRSLVFRASIVEEEFDSWRRGKKLAQRLGIDADYYNYDYVASRFLRTYADWFANADWSSENYDP